MGNKVTSAISINPITEKIDNPKESEREEAIQMKVKNLKIIINHLKKIYGDIVLCLKMLLKMEHATNKKELMEIKNRITEIVKFRRNVGR